jgi:hypothetical protein
VRYLVWSYDYRPDSAGPKVLHRLCHELNEAGQEAYVGFPKTNPAWNTPYRAGPLSGDWIAIYPEIVRGNPWRAPRVVRYVLNNPGKLGGDKVYDNSEIVFVYHELFNDLELPTERILYLPTIELDIYVDRRLPRRGELYYAGKGRKTRRLPGAVEITKALKSDRHRLADVLNRAEVMYTFDAVTGMADIARLCGCPVVIIPDGTRAKSEFDHWSWAGLGWDAVPPPFDSDVVRAEQLALYATFRERLPYFIQTTQA